MSPENKQERPESAPGRPERAADVVVHVELSEEAYEALQAFLAEERDRPKLRELMKGHWGHPEGYEHK